MKTLYIDETNGHKTIEQSKNTINQIESSNKSYQIINVIITILKSIAIEEIIIRYDHSIFNIAIGNDNLILLSDLDGILIINNMNHDNLDKFYLDYNNPNFVDELREIVCKFT